MKITKRIRVADLKIGDVLPMVTASRPGMGGPAVVLETITAIEEHDNGGRTLHTEWQIGRYKDNRGTSKHRLPGPTFVTKL